MLKPHLFLTLSDNDKILANQSIFLLNSSRPDLIIYGLGDLAVLPRLRGTGLAGRLIREAIAWSTRQNGNILLTNSETMHGYFLRLGFTPTPDADQRFRYELRGKEITDPGKLYLLLNNTEISDQITISSPVF